MTSDFGRATAFARRLGHGAQAVLRWWVDGLWAGLPPQLRDRWFVVRDELLLRLEKDQLRIDKAAEVAPPLSTVPLALLEHPSRELTEELARISASADLTLVLPDDCRLTSMLWLPAAAGNNLASVLYFELDRLTPFEIDSCAFDFRILERDKANDRIAVEFALVPRQTLDRYRERLANAGLQTSTVTVRNGEGQVLPLNLLGARPTLKLPGLRVAPRGALVGAAALALLAALYLPLAHYRSLLDELDSAVTEEREQAVAVRSKLNADDEIVAVIDYLNARRRSYEQPARLLAELSDVLPDDAWLTGFRLSRKELEIQGEAVAPSQVLEIVESTDVLEDASFRSPVSRSDISGKQRFAIAASVEGAR